MANRFALVIGNSLFQDNTLARLTSPEADVGALAEILMDKSVGGFDDVKLLLNVSSTTVRQAVSAFFSRRSRDDLLLLYFSSHGVLDSRGRLYLAVKDTDHNYPRANGVPAAFIADEMDNSHSQRQVLVLDCCYSGAFARGTKGTAGASVGAGLAFEGTGYGRVVLTATDATQYAWEGDQIIGEAQNSLFTHFLIEGLKTGAADRNADGNITVDELYDYVYEQIVKQTSQQTPGKWSYKEQGEIILARSQSETAPPEAKLIIPEESEVDLNQRLEQVYIEGLSAFWLGDWERAIRNFQAVVQVRPDYKDTAAKLEESRTELRRQELYKEATTAVENKDWNTALSRLDALLSENTEYKDARVLLEYVKVQQMLSDLYAQARALYQAEKWQAVLKIFSQIASLDPQYPDPEDLAASTHQILADLDRQKGLADLYRRGLVEMEAGQWQSAKQVLYQVQELEPGYQDTQGLLERADIEIEQEQAARQRQERIAAFYQEAIKLTHANQWPQAIEKIEAIQALDPEFDDPKKIVAKVRQEIAREQEEAQRQQNLPAEKALVQGRMPRWAWGLAAILAVVLVAIGLQRLRPAAFMRGPVSGQVAKITEHISPAATTMEPATIFNPSATPSGRVTVRLEIVSSSEWAFVRIVTDAEILDLSIVSNESHPDMAPEIILEEQSIWLGQPLRNAKTGNWINATVDVLIDFGAQPTQANQSRVEFKIEKGDIGETIVEVYNTAGREPIFLQKFIQTNVLAVEGPIESKLLLRPARQTAACLVSTNLGVTNTNRGISQAEGADELTRPFAFSTEAGGAKTARQGVSSPAPARYIYFRVDPAFQMIRNQAVLVITVEYLDRGSGLFYIEYNSSDKTHPNPIYKTTEKIVAVGTSGNWRTTRFWIYDAEFKGLQNLQADFRLTLEDDLYLVVNRLTVETRDCGG